ncbi:MAG: phosphoglucosamine mutase, partial [Clostridia bacterium]|nr:phosphoglucosamine mutase [Clostridia bacterium]
AMQQNGYRLGGEESGHIIFGKYATTGDGILTALKIVEVMLECKETLARLADGVTVYPQLLKNVRVKDKAKVLSSPTLAEVIAREEKHLGESGRILVRASGTEPLVRVMAEAESEALCQTAVDSIAAVLSDIERNE